MLDSPLLAFRSPLYVVPTKHPSQAGQNISCVMNQLPQPSKALRSR